MLALLGQLNRCWITLKASYYQDRNTRASVAIAKFSQAKRLETFWRLQKTFTFTMVIFQQNIFTFTQVWLYTTLQYCSISRSWRSNSDGEETWTQTTLCGERQQIKLKLCVATNQFLDDYWATNQKSRWTRVTHQLRSTNQRAVWNLFGSMSLQNHKMRTLATGTLKCLLCVTLWHLTGATVHGPRRHAGLPTVTQCSDNGSVMALACLAANVMSSKLFYWWCDCWQNKQDEFWGVWNNSLCSHPAEYDKTDRTVLHSADG